MRLFRKGRAGYLNGYADPEYVKSLHKRLRSFLGAGKYRAFPVSGDLVLRHGDESFIIVKYGENLGEIAKDKTYILITLMKTSPTSDFHEKTRIPLHLQPTL